MELVIGTVAVVAVLITLAAVRVSRIASWRSVAMMATSTGSLRACVDFVRYCDQLSGHSSGGDPMIGRYEDRAIRPDLSGLPRLDSRL